MDKNKRLALLRSMPTELLIDMLDSLDELEDAGKLMALEEITYVLYEREVKSHE